MWIVVEWTKEKSVSVLKEKDIARKEEREKTLVAGQTVEVPLGVKNGFSIHKAKVLAVFAHLISDDDDDEDADDNENTNPSKSKGNKKQLMMRLQGKVQQERVAQVLSQRRNQPPPLEPAVVVLGHDEEVFIPPAPIVASTALASKAQLTSSCQQQAPRNEQHVQNIYQSRPTANHKPLHLNDQQAMGNRPPTPRQQQAPYSASKPSYNHHTTITPQPRIQAHNHGQ
ncbi:hypothetical protein AC249_AIPGENE10825 [Exaiptasia diaphana]|nr:hypothetical protein AC249_AIPGENE10825 [Exaiptasia diaphana]